MTEQAAGSLRHRITVQRRTSAVGTRGQSTEAWEDLFSCYANVESLSGRELEQAQKTVATASTRITIRLPKQHTITTKDRVKYKNDFYNVGSSVELGTFRDDLVLLCERVV